MKKLRYAATYTRAVIFVLSRSLLARLHTSLKQKLIPVAVRRVRRGAQAAFRAHANERGWRRGEEETVLGSVGNILKRLQLPFSLSLSCRKNKKNYNYNSEASDFFFSPFLMLLERYFLFFIIRVCIASVHFFSLRFIAFLHVPLLSGRVR